MYTTTTVIGNLPEQCREARQCEYKKLTRQCVLSFTLGSVSILNVNLCKISFFLSYNIKLPGSTLTVTKDAGFLLLYKTCLN